ncbi:MAG: oligoendopeptidase F, partial [Enterococcus sp.]|nr:oligoendopeptidase F [Enterococcus sp.]
MSEAKQLPKRQEIPAELTWDLTKIFADDAAFEKEFQSLSAELSKVTEIKGTLHQGAVDFLTAIEYVLDIYRKAEVIYVYAHLKND